MISETGKIDKEVKRMNVILMVSSTKEVSQQVCDEIKRLFIPNIKHTDFFTIEELPDIKGKKYHVVFSEEVFAKTCPEYDVRYISGLFTGFVKCFIIMQRYYNGKSLQLLELDDLLVIQQ